MFQLLRAEFYQIRHRVAPFTMLLLSFLATLGIASLATMILFGEGRADGGGDEQQGEDKQCFFHGMPSCAVAPRVEKPGFIPLGRVWALCSSRICRASGSFVLSAGLVVASRAGMCRQHLPCRAILWAVVLQVAK